MKRTAAILFLLSLTAPLFLTTFYYNIRISAVKKEVRKQIEWGLEDHQLTLLTFTLQEMEILLEWEHEKEFEYNDIMYDVVRSDTTGNKVQLWCWKDHEESELNERLEELSDIAMNKDPVQKENQKKVNHFLRCLFFDNNAGPVWIMCPKDISHYIFSEEWESVSIPPPTPPPTFS